VKKIVVLGPESTGKTDLCRALSDQFASPWIPEYAREYVAGLNRAYTYADVEVIARQQMHEQKEAKQLYADADYVFFDTDLVITKVWFLHGFNRCPEWLQPALESSEVDLYLVCKPDIPWEYDPVRENPDIREFLYDWYKRELEALHKPFVEISGLGTARLQNAVAAIQNL
jgi:nicotinamide riboside kinase